MAERSNEVRAKATAFAPATVANVAVGFDILGFALDGVGDEVTVARDPSSDGVRIESITGIVPGLPLDPLKNTASVALLAMLEEQQPGHGFTLSIHKGIPLGSGMGGSAASAVAAVVAADGLLDCGLGQDALLRYAMAGEGAASGAAHPDNAAACLHGGLTAVVGVEPPRVEFLPVPESLICVLVHPHIEIKTRDARAALPTQLDLHVHVEQSMALCGFLAGCYLDDLDRIARSMVDHVAEPTRGPLIPGFAGARAAALDAGAIAFGISGSGPSVFAWAGPDADLRGIAGGVAAAFRTAGVESDSWIGPIRHEGARVTTGGRRE